MRGESEKSVWCMGWEICNSCVRWLSVSVALCFCYLCEQVMRREVIDFDSFRSYQTIQGRSAVAESCGVARWEWLRPFRVCAVFLPYCSRSSLSVIDQTEPSFTNTLAE